MDKILVSTVTPVYAGEATLMELADLLLCERQAWERDQLPLELVEAIFVDDGSIDGSEGVLRDLEERQPWIHVVTLSRNFGQHPATAAGILHSSGDWVATLDEDLQHEPRHLTALLRAAVDRGLDVIYARPRERVHESWVRDWGSRLYKWLLAKATGNPDVKSFNSFRLLRGSIARAAASVSAHDTYLDVVLGWFSKRVGTVPIRMKDRRYIEQGASGYTLHGLLSHARRLLISSQTKWLRSGAVVGVGALVLSVALALFILGQKLIDPASIDVRGWLSLFLAVVFFGGLSSLLLGVLLEYLSTLLQQSQGRPGFFVVDRSGDAILRQHFAQQDRDAPAPSATPTPRGD